MAKNSVRSEVMDETDAFVDAQMVTPNPVSGVPIPDRPVVGVGIKDAVQILGDALRDVVPKEEHGFLIVRPGWTFHTDRSGSEGIEIFLGDRLVTSSTKRIGEVLASNTMDVHAAGINEKLHSKFTQKPTYSRHELVYECVKEFETLFSEEGVDPSWRANYISECFGIDAPDSTKGLMLRLRALKKVLVERLKVRKAGRPKKNQDCEGPDEDCQSPQ